MNQPNGIHVAVVGLGFGAEFVPIYLHHPDVAAVTVCDLDQGRLEQVRSRYPVTACVTDFNQIVGSSEIDAVHLVTGIPSHAGQAVAVLGAGKHCACTVPMATRISDLRAIIAAQRSSSKTYMMMETAVYTRHFLMVKDMLQQGALGRIQFLRGAHYQDMERWPAYWMGLPPMHYATHAMSPLLALAGTRARQVHCFGSGQMREELHIQYGNPYPVETAIFRLEGSDVAAEVTRTLFHTARAYAESFQVFGDVMSFEWEQVEGEEPVLFRFVQHGEPGRGQRIATERVAPPDRQDLLPPEIARFTRQGVYNAEHTHLSFLQGGGHEGSHPHLVHEFVRSIVEGRPPAIDAVTAANWTAAGICAHESAMQGGALVEIPAFE